MTEGVVALVGLGVMASAFALAWFVVGSAMARQMREDQRKAKEASDAAWMAKAEEWNR